MRNAWKVSLFGMVVAVASLAAADAPYVGKWKLNMEKSDFGQTTITFAAAGGGFKTTAMGQSYTFMADGKDTPTPWGDTAAWKSTGAMSWETVYKTNGKVTNTDAIKLSPDGKTLTIDSKVMKADGTSSNDSTVYTRVSGGPGLAGTWKTAKTTSSAPDSMEIAAKGPDGVTLRYANAGGMCEGQFDGKDNPASGAMWPAGWTCSLKKMGATGFTSSWKKDGKLMFTSDVMASTDGKTLTETTSVPGSSEKAKAVFDRQ